jgi:DNA-binding protein H-NS
MSSVAELIAKKAEIEKMIADAQREEKASAIAQVKSLMAQHGLTMADLTARAAPGPRRSNGPRAGGKVAAKYRDPDSGREWTGRGLKPTWLRNALAAGKTLQDFAI